MRLTKTFYNENYWCTVKLIITSDYVKQVKSLYKKAKIEENAEECEGEVIQINNDYIILVINQKYLSWNTIFHEVYHLTNAICDVRNINNEEAKSWVSGWIGGKISKFLKNKKITPICG
jgi:hypothetical protein